MEQEATEVKNLKNFSLFLLRNHLHDFIHEIRDKDEKACLASLQFLKDLPEEQTYEYYQLSSESFLNDLSLGDGVGSEITFLEKSNLNQREIALTSTGIISFFSIRKKALIHLLSLYNSTISEYRNILLELEDFCLSFYKVILKNDVHPETELKVQEERNFSETIHNVRERKEKEFEITQFGGYNLSLFESFPTMLWRSGPDGKWDYCNSTWLSFTGRTLEQERGDGWTERIHPDDSKKIMNIYIECFNERRPFEMEFRLKGHDGKYRWILSLGRAYKDIHNNFAGYIGTCYDITKRKAAEETSREKTQVLENILFNIPLVVIQLDENGIISEMTGKGLKKLGIRDNQYVGISIFEIYPEAVHRIEKALNGKSSSFTSEKEFEGITTYFQNNYFFNAAKGKGAIGLMFDITDHKVIERELMEKNQLLDGIMNNIPGIITRVDERGDIMESLGAGLTKLGKKENDSRGMNIMEAYPDYAKYIEKALNGEKIHYFSKVTQDAREHYYNTYLFPDNIAGKGAITFSLDVTDQKVAEETARELNESLKHAVEGIALVDKEGKYVSVNKAKANTLGYYADEMIGMDWKQTIHPDDLHLASEVYEKMKMEGKSYFEGRGIRKDGSIFYKELTLISNVDKDGTFKGHHSFMRDITFRKESEERLRRSEALLMESQKIANVGSWEWDIASNEVLWSERLFYIYGVSLDTRINYDAFLEKAHPDDKEMLNAEIMKAYETREPFSVEHRIITPEGKQKYLLCKGMVICDEKGKQVRMLGSGLDITDIKESEEALQTAYSNLQKTQEELQRINLELERRVQERTEELSMKNEEMKQKNAELIKINADLDNFVYTASHDLKAPISNIEGLMVALRSDMDAQEKLEIKTLLDMIDISVGKFKSTIRDLTEITKIQKNIDSDVEEVSIEELLNDVKINMKDEIQESGAVIHANLEIAVLKFSPKNLRSIIYNLINNAVKYRSPDRTPEIRVSTIKNENGSVILSVKDNGLGMDERYIDKIFSMFKRLHDHVDGSGVGLYIVKRIIDNSGGRIEVASELDKGSEFKIYFQQ